MMDIAPASQGLLRLPQMNARDTRGGRRKWRARRARYTRGADDEIARRWDDSDGGHGRSVERRSGSASSESGGKCILSCLANHLSFRRIL
jgi:hypothetical protein